VMAGAQPAFSSPIKTKGGAVMSHPCTSARGRLSWRPVRLKLRATDPLPVCGLEQYGFRMP